MSAQLEADDPGAAERMRQEILSRDSHRFMVLPLPRFFEPADEEGARILEEYIRDLRDEFFRARSVARVIELYQKVYEIERELAYRSTGIIHMGLGH